MMPLHCNIFFAAEPRFAAFTPLPLSLRHIFVFAAQMPPYRQILIQRPGAEDIAFAAFGYGAAFADTPLMPPRCRLSSIAEGCFQRQAAIAALFSIRRLFSAIISRRRR
jgi:hypothetical protein